MPTYDVSGHALLSGEAENLGQDELDAQTAVAEDLLDLAGTSLTGDAKAKARRAIAIQVSHQIRLPDEFAYAESEGRGGQQIRYRDTDAALSPTAERLADEITSGSDEIPQSGAARAEFRTEAPQ